MIWKTKNYRLGIFPQCVRTSPVEYKELKCDVCFGAGEIYQTAWSSEKCDHCNGVGIYKIPLQIEQPPEIDPDFLIAITDFVRDYRDKYESNPV